MLRERRIPLASLPPSPFDNPLGESSGAGMIFGNTGAWGAGLPWCWGGWVGRLLAAQGQEARRLRWSGAPACQAPAAPAPLCLPHPHPAGGVMEAALRTAYELATGAGGGGCQGRAVGAAKGRGG